jgi:hypothetical protein
MFVKGYAIPFEPLASRRVRGPPNTHKLPVCQ